MEKLKYRTKQQHKVLFGLLSKLNWLNWRKELALQYSDGRTSSTTKLYIEECDSFILFLKCEVKREQETKEPSKLDIMRRKFFYYCHELKWKKGSKLDYAKIDNWLVKYGYLHKSLNDYTQQEMYKLLQQLEKVLEKKPSK